LPASFTIGLGYWDTEQPNSWSVIKKVARIIIHESYQYDEEYLPNDIALIKLDVSRKDVLF
jgi:hypothetical protein